MSPAAAGSSTRAYLAAQPRTGLGRMALYAVGMLSYVSMLRMVSSWLQKHLVPPTEALIVVDLLWFGAVFAVGRFYLDAVTDPVVGHWSDHTRSRWGRRKPFIAAGLFPTVACLVLLFAMQPDKLFGVWAFPDGSADWVPLINGLVYTLLATVFFVASTLLAMPYLATIPEITPHPTDRKLLTTGLGVMVVLGTILGQALPGFFPSLTQAALVVGGVGLVSMGVVLLFFHNPPWARFGYVERSGDSAAATTASEPPHVSARHGMWMLVNSLAYGLWLGLRALGLLLTWPVWRLMGIRVVLVQPHADDGSPIARPDAVPLVLGDGPEPLRPLGRSLRELARFHPFRGFLAAFISLHAAFVLMSAALPYIPQTLLGLNSATAYHAYVTGELMDHGGDPLLALFRLPTLAADWQAEHEREPFLLVLDGTGEYGGDGAQAPAERLALVDPVAAAAVLRAVQAQQPRADADMYGRALQTAGVLVARGPLTAAQWHKAVLEKLDAAGNLQAGLILGATLGSTLLLGIPLILLLLFMIGKRRTAVVSLLVFVLVPLATPFVALQGVAIPGWQLIYAIGILIGVALAGIFILDNLLLADVVQMDTALTGLRRESLYFGIYGLAMKMGIGVAIALTTLLFHGVGFTFAQPWGVRLAGPVASVLVVAGVVLFVKLYPSDDEVERIVRGA